MNRNRTYIIGGPQSSSWHGLYSLQKTLASQRHVSVRSADVGLGNCIIKRRAFTRSARRLVVRIIVLLIGRFFFGKLLRHAQFIAYSPEIIDRLHALTQINRTLFEFVGNFLLCVYSLFGCLG